VTDGRSTDDGSISRQAWRLSGMGLEFVSTIAGMALAGWLIDRWAQTSPRWTIVGVVLGLVGGGYNFMRQAVQAGRAAEREYRRAHPHDTDGNPGNRGKEGREAEDGRDG